MKHFLSVILIITIAIFLVSCGKEKEESIYGDVTNDKSNEDPDETADYQTIPDTNDIEINDDLNDENTSDVNVNDDDAIVDVTKDMILIPQGKAWIGCNENIETECPLSELPYHEVSMKAYFIDKYEVTVADFEKCINAGGCGAEEDTYNKTGTDQYCNFGSSKTNHPMNCVSWEGARAYCVWAGKRLPSEGEWEKAARGGCEIHSNDDCETNSYIYTWGNEGTPDCSKISMATKTDSEINYGCGANSTAVGGSYPSSNSPYGVSDMLGNLFEFVADKWVGNHDLAKPDGSSVGVPENQAVIKGGGFMTIDTEQLRISNRNAQNIEEIFDTRGFRCAADVE